MSGFFGCVSRKDCVADVFYGTDYHSHLGTKRAGLAFYNGTDFNRSIHSLESAYFRNKFEPELDRFAGSNLGIGVISDMESQPITVTFSPILAFDTSVHLWLLCKPCIDSAILCSLYFYYIFILITVWYRCYTANLLLIRFLSVKELNKLLVALFHKLLLLEFLVLVHAHNKHLLSVCSCVFCLVHDINKLVCRIFLLNQISHLLWTLRNLEAALHEKQDNSLKTD